MQEKDIEFLEESFKQFYFEHFDLLHVPENPNQREFGFQKFNSGMKRHISLKTDKDLHLLLMQNTPSDLYCSNARYSFPNLPMSEKDWQNADLIFDIDAKDLHLDVRNEHCCIKCSDCSEISPLKTSCPKCESSKISIISLTCKSCIKAVKEEVRKLDEILTNDFSIDKNDVKTFFSGNEGFHLHVKSTSYQDLGSKERAELTDYIMFRGIIPETLGFKKFNPEKSSFPNYDDLGWRGRAAKQMYATKSKKSESVKQIISSGYTNFQKNLEEMKEQIGVKIDPNVTVDIHRIFRLAGSINSKSGLTKILVDDLEKFDPYVDACLFNDEEITLRANCPISFTLKNKNFGPYSNEITTVPRFAAIYMICKGVASLT